MMFVMTAFSTIFSFVTLVHQDELVPFFAFVSDHPEIHLHFVAFGVCSTIGQLLIFHTIRSFGAVVFAIIMTVRWTGFDRVDDYFRGRSPRVFFRGVFF